MKKTVITVDFEVYKLFVMSVWPTLSLQVQLHVQCQDRLYRKVTARLYGNKAHPLAISGNLCTG